MRKLVLLWLSAACFGQSPLARSLDLQRASIEKQRASLERGSSLQKQKASVRKQALKQVPAEEGFHTIPWPDPPKLPPADITRGFPCEPLGARDLLAYTGRASQRTGIAQEILQAVIRQESGGRACAISAKGAVGLMQLMPATASELGVEDALDPEENLAAGSRFLRGLLDRYSGDLSLALAAYNAGPGRVDRAGGIPPIPETQNYVKSILQRLAPTMRIELPVPPAGN